jgi:hypothetical protein
VDATNNRVGIGTASPSHDLHVIGSTNGRIQVEGSSGFGMVFVQASSGQSAQLQLNSNGGSGRRFAIASSSAGTFDLSDETAASTRLSVAANGNLAVDTNTLFVDAANNRVGVGTASPLTRMHINDGTNRNILISTDATQFGSSGMAVGSFTDGAAGYAPLVLIGSTVQVAAGGSIRTTLDASGNLGLGVTPSAWSSGGNIQLGNNKAIIGTGEYINVGANWFFDGANKYVTNGFASNYFQNLGTHIWYTAASGTAGNAISFTQAMTLDASGNLGVFDAAPQTTLNNFSASSRGISISNAYPTIALSDTGNATWQFFLAQDVGEAYLWNRANGPLILATNNTERARITATGELLVGTTSTGTGNKFRVGDTNGTLEYGAPTGGSGRLRYEGGPGNVFFIDVNNATGAIAFRTESSGAVERARIKSTGQVRFVPLSADPSGAETGDVYYNSSTNKLRVYNGAWVDLH